MTSFFKQSAVWGLLLLLILQLSPSLIAQPRIQHRLPEADRLDTDEAAEVLARFRSYTYDTDHLLRFRLKHLPFRARGNTYHGFLMGSFDPNTLTHLQRITIETPRSAFREDPASPIKEILIIRGFEYAVYTKVGEEVTLLDESEYLTPILEDLEITYFDLLIPFLYWNYEYSGPSQLKARPIQTFTMFPPKGQYSASGLDRLIISLDDEASGLLRYQAYDAEETLIRTMELLSIQQSDGLAIPRRIDYKNQLTRDKTRIEIIAASMDENFSKDAFQPDTFAASTPDITSSILDVF